MSNLTTNIIIAGLGGQGVLTSANVISYAAFLAGYDVKQSEIHGMSQRGGSLSSDIRFGDKVHSPMIPRASADFILLLSDTEKERSLQYIKPDTGIFLHASDINISELPAASVLNTALLGKLSKSLTIDYNFWEKAINYCTPKKYISENISAFKIGITL